MHAGGMSALRWQSASNAFFRLFTPYYAFLWGGGGKWSNGVLELWEKTKSQTQKRPRSGDLPLIYAYIRLNTPNMENIFTSEVESGGKGVESRLFDLDAFGFETILGVLKEVISKRGEALVISAPNLEGERDRAAAKGGDRAFRRRRVFGKLPRHIQKYGAGLFNVRIVGEIERD